MNVALCHSHLPPDGMLLVLRFIGPSISIRRQNAAAMWSSCEVIKTRPASSCTYIANIIQPFLTFQNFQFKKKMSLIPFFLDETPLFRPSRLLDQRFGHTLDPEDLLQPLILPRISRSPAGYIRNWRSVSSADDSGSVVSYEKDKFQANLDVQQFKPEEITVKVTGENILTIEGKLLFLCLLPAVVVFLIGSLWYHYIIVRIRNRFCGLANKYTYTR